MFKYGEKETIAALIAEHQHTAEKDLVRLARDTETYTKFLEWLALVGGEETRIAVISNPSFTDKDKIVRMADPYVETSPFVRDIANMRLAAENEHNIDKGVSLYKLQEVYKRNWVYAIFAAGQPTASPDMLEELAKHDNPWVRLAVVDNDRAPVNALRILLSDSVNVIARKAKLKAPELIY